MAWTSAADLGVQRRGRRAGTRRPGTAGGPSPTASPSARRSAGPRTDAAATTPRRPGAAHDDRLAAQLRAAGAARPTRRTRPCRRGGSCAPPCAPVCQHRGRPARHRPMSRRRTIGPRALAAARTTPALSAGGRRRRADPLLGDIVDEPGRRDAVGRRPDGARPPRSPTAMRPWTCGRRSRPASSVRHRRSSRSPRSGAAGATLLRRGQS